MFVTASAALNTPVIVPGTPAVPQTPLEPPTEFVDHSEMTKREKMKRLDMINVSLRLLKLQRDEALTKNDKEGAMILMRSLDHTQEEKRKLEDELEACDTSGENVKDDDDDNNNDADTDHW